MRSQDCHHTVHSLATDPSLILDSLLEGKPHLDELYGSGDFKYNKNDVDSHYAFSVESLVRLFKIEKRFIQDLQSLYFNIGEKVETQNCNKTVLPELAPPQLSDEEFLSAPPVGLYRIQSLHNISISSLTKGLLGHDVPTSPHRLGWEDCVLVAQKAGDKNDLARRVEWLEVALQLCQEVEGGNCATVRNILQEAIENHDNIALSHGKFVINKTFPTVTRIVPFNKTLALKHKKKVKRWQTKFSEYVDKFPMFAESEEAPADIFFADSVAHFDKISEQCQDLPDSAFLPRQVSLQCHHLHRQLPHLRLAPVRLEILSQTPGVAALHGLLTERQCEEMKEKGRGRMKVTPFAIRQSDKRLRNTYSDRRMSKIRYLSHRRDLLARRLNRKLSDTLELELDGGPIPAEHYQLMNYGLGGYIQLHLDTNQEKGREVEYSSPEDWLVDGERLMTVMVYLSSPKGGHTVFPLLGLSSAPTPGTALVWHTVDTKGRPHQRMKHLGCPVVWGDKWIVNKWVKWHHHMFSHPCHPDREFYSFNV